MQTILYNRTSYYTYWSINNIEIIYKRIDKSEGNHEIGSANPTYPTPQNP